ncbi:MAG: hypothetical protein LUC89_09470, partial [Oscillospiraceae bacterium]|nr:hypothetical protein [Oscillospiraceae bacterium]
MTDGEITGQTGIEIKMGTLEVSGGTITGTGEYAEGYPMNGGSEADGSAILVSGQMYGSAITQYKESSDLTVTISGGTLTSNEGVGVKVYETDKIEAQEVTVTLEGGTYEGEVAGAAVVTTGDDAKYSENITETITGGTYTSVATITASTTEEGTTYEVAEDASAYLDESVTTLATYTDEDGTTYYGYYANADSALAASPTGATVTAISSDEEEDGKTTTYTVIRAATCTTNGVAKVVTVTPSEEYGSEATTTTKYVAIPATGHSYKTYTWTWAEDYSTATVTSTCTNCGEEATFDANVTSVTTDATCQAEGSIVYTAAATVNEVEVTDTKTVTLEKTEHTPGEAVYTGNCVSGNAVKTVTCTECDEIISEENIEQAEHHSYVYDENDVVWTPVTDDDGNVTGYTVSVTAHCQNCARTNTDNTDRVATYDVTKKATCTEAGSATVTATTTKLWWYDAATGETTFTTKTLTAELEIPQLSETGEHNYKETLVDATCTEAA